MELRSYQREIIDYVEGAVAFGSTKLIVEAPTGSGKSLLIAELARKYPTDKIMILVNVSKLVGQIAHHLDALGVDYSVLKAGMEAYYDESKRVQLVMEQTYDARKEKLSIEADIIIRDEHHIGFTGSRFSGIMGTIQPRLVIGFSATPYDSRGVGLPGYETAQFVDIKKLTEDGYLMAAKTHIPAFGQNIDLEKIGKSGDYSESELDNLLNNPEYNQEVVEEYRAHHSGRKTIIFVAGIQHAIDLADAFLDGGIDANVLHSKLKPQEQIENMDQFTGKSLIDELDILITVSMLTTGFDMPDCSTVINCRPTKVRSLKVQMEGRVLRPTEDPLATARIIDCCRATSTHGFYDEPFTIHPTLAMASEERKRRSEPIIDYMVVDLKRITPTKWDAGIEYEECNRSKATKARVWKMSNADNARDAIIEASYLMENLYKIPHQPSKVDWIMEEVEPAMSWMSLKTIKNRLRKMVIEGKKLGGIRGYPKWFKENVIGGNR